MHSCPQPMVLKCGCLHGTLRMGQRFFTVVLPHPIFCLLSCWKGRGKIFPYSFCCWRPSLRSICITVVAIPDRNKEERSIWAYSPRGCGPCSQAWGSSCSWNMKQASHMLSDQEVEMTQAVIFQGLPLATYFYQVGASFQNPSKMVPSAEKQGFKTCEHLRLKP